MTETKTIQMEQNKVVVSNPTTYTSGNQVVAISSVACKNCGSNAVVKFGLE